MTTGPRRLVHDDADLASMLAAADNEGPSEAEFERALSLADRVPLTAPSTIWRWLGPTLAGIAVMGTTLGVVVMRTSTSANIPMPVEAAATPRPPSAPRVEAAAAPMPPAVMTVSVDELATVTTTRPSADTSARRRDTAAPKASAAHSTFAEEVALVAAARSALERGDAVACKRTVEQYHERFRAGTFAQELEVIRIEALLMNGEGSRAQAAAERFLAANERSPYADRVRSLAEHASHR